MNLIRLCKIDSNVMVYLLDISWKFCKTISFLFRFKYIPLRKSFTLQ